MLRTGAPRRMLPTDVPPWYVVYQQTQHWQKEEVFEHMVHDLRILLRETTVRPPQPRAVILDSRALQSTPESGGRDGYDGQNGATARRCIWLWVRWGNC